MTLAGIRKEIATAFGSLSLDDARSALARSAAATTDQDVLKTLDKMELEAWRGLRDAASRWVRGIRIVALFLVIVGAVTTLSVVVLLWDDMLRKNATTHVLFAAGAAFVLTGLALLAWYAGELARELPRLSAHIHALDNHHAGKTRD